MIVSAPSASIMDILRAIGARIFGGDSQKGGEYVIPRIDLAASWTANNPVLGYLEIGFELDTGKCKIGNSVTAWNSLGYFTPTLNNIPTPTGTVQMGGQYVSNVAAPFFGNDAANKTYGGSGTKTMTNTRTPPRVLSAASASPLTTEKDTYDLFKFTALAAALNIANHSTSTPSDGEQIRIRLLDNGTARALTYGTNYVAKGGTALPNTTVLGKNMELLFEWDSGLVKYNLMAVTQET